MIVFALLPLRSSAPLPLVDPSRPNGFLVFHARDYPPGPAVRGRWGSPDAYEQTAFETVRRGCAALWIPGPLFYAAVLTGRTQLPSAVILPGGR